MSEIQKSTLKNGVQVITRPSSNHSSVSLGIWLTNGARHQKHDESGYAHLLEHLVFRKTRRFSGKQLSQQFEAMGGQINAETGRELTAFYGLVPEKHLLALLDLFTSMLLECDFDQNDLDIEREVVLQELGMLHDDPEEELEDFGSEQVWKDHPMGWQILGDTDSLHNTSLNGMKQYLSSILQPSRIVIVAAGKVNHEELVKACEPFSHLAESATPATNTPVFSGSQLHTEADHEQTHMLWVMPAPSASSKEQACYTLADHMLAGGSSSLLYQKIREEMGLVYSIHSRCDSYSDCGLWFIQTSTHPENTQQCFQTIEQEIKRWIETGPTQVELDQAREHTLSSLTLEDDDLEAVMDRIARENIYLGHVPDLATRLQQYEKITPADIQNALEKSWKQHAFFSSGPNKPC